MHEAHMPGDMEDWNDDHYDDQDSSIGNCQGKRPRRRRRHKKQAVGTITEDAPRGTPLTLAQLGINIPPPPPVRKNVVTWSDLALGGEAVAKKNQGDLDSRSMHPTPLVSVPTPQRPQSYSTMLASAPWPTLETQLLASSPLHGGLAIGIHQYHMPTSDIQRMPLQPTTAWISEPAIAARHWPCSLQYAYEPITQQGDSNPAQMFGCTLAANAPAPAEILSLEVVLKNLAAETYED